MDAKKYLKSALSLTTTLTLLSVVVSTSCRNLEVSTISQRQEVVNYILTIVKNEDEFSKDASAIDVTTALAVDDLNKIDAYVQAIQRWQVRLEKEPLPVGVPELGELKSDELKAVGIYLDIYKLLYSSHKDGTYYIANEQVSAQLEELNNSRDSKFPYDLLETILAKYDISDAEVNFQRPTE